MNNPAFLCPLPVLCQRPRPALLRARPGPLPNFSRRYHGQVSMILRSLNDAIFRGKSSPNESQTVLSSSALGAEKLQSFQKRVTRINDMEASIENLSDSELRERVAQIREQVQGGNSLDSALEEIFALVREATFRVLGLRHYDVQLIGGMVLHYGCVAEMVTGEGKTIVAVLAACLNALSGNAVYVVTVNDYLAKRDAELVGQVHRFLGLTVGLIQSTMETSERQKAYSCDVIYVTNSELGFDYLRDNLAMTENDIVLKRPLSYCIVDEADSILIDEARTPLLISGKLPIQTSKYDTAKKAADALSQDIHYTVNEKEQSVLLTERGYLDLEQALKVENLFDPSNPWAAFITNALKAKEIFKKDINYIIADADEQDDAEIQIVDEFTGRVMKGRRWSDGLHQAIEAKEGITVNAESSTAAKISYQAFFRLFDKLSGMTGTAATEAKELLDVYGLDVVVVPTALPMARKDYPDVVFRNEDGKYRAIMGEIARVAPTGRPILIGTTSVEASEVLSKLLIDVGVDHDILNAKPESAMRESEIVAQAGRKYSITIATNMAGRGTDILMGGNASYFARALARRALAVLNKDLCSTLNLASQPILIDDEMLPADISEEAAASLREAAKTLAGETDNPLSSLAQIDEVVGIAAEYGPIPENRPGLQLLRDSMSDIKEELEEVVAEEREEVLDLGGLYIIGTDRAESRRVDNQLRGRAGRQGDPGGSRFFLALEDRIFRVFGGDKVTGILDTFRVDENTPIENPLVNRTLDEAQRNVEAYFRDIREQLFRYDAVLSRQREVFYTLRRRIVVADDQELYDRFREECVKTISEIIPNYVGRGDAADDFEKLSAKLLQFFTGMSDVEAPRLQEALKLKEYVVKQMDSLLSEKRHVMDRKKDGLSREVVRYLWLTQTDTLWLDHMKKLDYLKEFIVLRSYEGEDPLQAYQREGFELFNDMVNSVRRNNVFSFFQYRLSA
ncbi:unnamed protein product [Agarophyton chilense]|eukprot:gb/GEZJ01000508.1/.p1 GENE.gb/GEZJ01000508.1/~~gb/GEZJ01000508.1/.p1  ORF type:complete len:966 (-),score=177.83 gb/GEZJ01000508.1/:1370-4267(-)